MEADRHNSILRSLLLLVAETIRLAFWWCPTSQWNDLLTRSASLLKYLLFIIFLLKKNVKYNLSYIYYVIKIVYVVAQSTAVETEFSWYLKNDFSYWLQIGIITCHKQRKQLAKFQNLSIAPLIQAFFPFHKFYLAQYSNMIWSIMV